MEISPEIVSLVDEIRNDKVHGASQLARQAVKVLKVAAERSQAASVAQLLGELREVGERLMSARPAMAMIFNISSRFLDAVSGVSPDAALDEAKSLAMAKADELAKASLQATAKIASYGSGLIADGDRIMTHSYSSTVMAVLKETFAQDKHIQVIATRSGAGGTGQRIAQELGHHGLPVIFTDDAAIGLYISRVSKAMVGAASPAEIQLRYNPPGGDAHSRPALPCPCSCSRAITSVTGSINSSDSACSMRRRAHAWVESIL